MPGLDALLPKLPPWLIPPVAILLVLIFAWPTLRDIWREIVPSYRAYSREKMRLELLKLAYEIEAIKKSAGITDSGPTVSETIRVSQAATSEGFRTTNQSTRNAINKSQAFMYGAIGGLSVSAVQVVLVDFEFILNDSLIVLTAYAVRVLVLAVLGGITAIATKPASPTDAFLRGLIVPMLLALVISANMYRTSHGVGPLA